MNPEKCLSQYANKQYCSPLLCSYGLVLGGRVGNWVIGETWKALIFVVLRVYLYSFILLLLLLVARAMFLFWFDSWPLLHLLSLSYVINWNWKIEIRLSRLIGWFPARLHWKYKPIRLICQNWKLWCILLICIKPSKLALFKYHHCALLPKIHYYTAAN